MQNITVKPHNRHDGRAQRVAKGMGKQRTVSLDYSKSDDWNSGTAAGTLGLILGWQASDHITREGHVYTNHSR